MIQRGSPLSVTWTGEPPRVMRFTLVGSRTRVLNVTVFILSDNSDRQPLRQHLCRIRFSRSRFGLGFSFGRFGFAGCELELHLPFFFVVNEEGGERTSFFGNEFVQEVRLAGLEELDDLRRFDLALQNNFAGAEVAGLVRAGRLLADVLHAVLEDAVAAFRTFA